MLCSGMAGYALKILHQAVEQMQELDQAVYLAL